MGCVKKDSSLKKTRRSSAKEINKKIDKASPSEQEAKLFDLAIPIDALPVKEHISEFSYGYRSSMAFNQLNKFIEDEMESLGWNLIIKHQEKEGAFIFEKPHKYSLVSVRQKKDKNLVLIITFPK